MLAALDAVLRELTLIAAIGFLVGGIDDLAVDFIYFTHRLRMVRRDPAPRRADAGAVAVFVPAWDESAVLEPMLRQALARYGDHAFDLFVGCYPNDPATIAAARRVAADDARIHVVVGHRSGPTTKADNLNGLWRALLALEAQRGIEAAAVVLHDAEDLVHPQELAVFERLIRRYDLVQLPVLPLVVPGSPLVSGHYADEFAEGHTRSLVVREAIGAALPLAGTGCAIARAMIGHIADARAGAPFDESSLTEDYELGLHVDHLAGHATFARVRGRDGRLVAVRAYFPATYRAAIRQKARWMTGISLAGWDRVGWGRWHRLADHWMRARDRRAPAAVVVILAGWLALLLSAVVPLLHLAAGRPLPAVGAWLRLVLAVDTGLLGWRAAMRMVFTGRLYGVRQALLSLPRMVVANAIMILAARKALIDYVRMLRGGAVVWMKTDHAFPDQLP